MRKIALPRVFFYLLFASNLIACNGQNTFTGVFVSDSRPREMVYLGLTQTGSSVSGSLIIVTPDDNGSTSSNTMPVRGTTDMDAITLTADRFLGDLVINGRKQGETVALMFPTDSGSISQVILKPATENDYNLSVGQWQKELIAIHLEKEKLSTIANNEKERLIKLATILSDDINELKDTRINRNLDDIKSALDGEASALNDLENDLVELRNDASVLPMTCYQANSKVSYDFNSRMSYSFNSRLGYSNERFMANIDDLEKRLSNVKPFVAEIRQKTQTLAQAIKESTYTPLPKMNIKPNDANQIMDQYEALAASARNQISVLKSSHTDILKKAKKIMNEGEAMLKTAQASVRCN